MNLGVRTALGATRGGLIGIVLREGLSVITIGLACGVGLAALFGVATLDSTAFVLAPAVLLVIAVTACLIVTARITNLNVSQALAAE